MRGRGKRGQLLSVSLVDGISISNHMAKHRNTESVHCRFQNVASACNEGGSSSLHTKMNAAARLMQPLQCSETDLKTSQCFLQHASITQRTAQHARRCSRTCTFFTRPRVTRSITIAAQLHDMWAMCVSAGAVTSRWHANATQGSMRRTRQHGEHSATTQPRGDSACCRRWCAKNHFWCLMSLSTRMICARSSLGDGSLPPTGSMTIATRVPVRQSGNARTLGDSSSEEEDATSAIVLATA